MGDLTGQREDKKKEGEGTEKGKEGFPPVTKKCLKFSRILETYPIEPGIRKFGIRVF